MQTLDKQSNKDIDYIIDEPINLGYLLNMVRNSNIQNAMNKKQIESFLSDVKAEKCKIDDIIQELGKMNMPVGELEKRSKLIGSMIPHIQEYLATKGTSGMEIATKANGLTPKAHRDDYLADLILGIEPGTPFDIIAVRRMAFDTHGDIFKDTKEFFGIYWRVVKALQEKNKLKVNKPGAGRRATVFETVSKN